jgi:hypothetical protein
LTLTDFTFPANLEDKFAAFRLVVTLRYVDENDDILTAMEVIPGVGKTEYWECEKGNKDKINYVRHPTLPKLDTDKVDEMQRQAIFSKLKIKKLERVSVKIYDVEKDGKMDKLFREGLKLAFQVALEFAETGLPITIGNVKKKLEEKLGANVERGVIESKVLEAIDKLANAGKTRRLWEHSAKIGAVASGGSFNVTGGSNVGDFALSFSLEK